MSQQAFGADLLEVEAMRSVEELLVVLLSAVSMPNRSRITLDSVVTVVGFLSGAGKNQSVFHENWHAKRILCYLDFEY